MNKKLEEFLKLYFKNKVLAKKLNDRKLRRKQNKGIILNFLKRNYE